eukprot:m.608729 g.608729  ORF g.608729 m.608729 type:complete len:101 (-) comp22488_c0_seq17:2437-2739(-)
MHIQKTQHEGLTVDQKKALVCRLEKFAKINYFANNTAPTPVNLFDPPHVSNNIVMCASLWDTLWCTSIQCRECVCTGFEKETTHFPYLIERIFIFIPTLF